MKLKIVAQGAEAIIKKHKEGILKERVKKKYRHPDLDKSLIKKRTKAETKLLKKASLIINVPDVLDSTEGKIFMEKVLGDKLSSRLNSYSNEKQKKVMTKVGEAVAKIHKEGIIHGDLTTSNMILVPPQKPSQMYSSKIPLSKENSSLITSSQSDLTTSVAKQPLANHSEPTIFLIDFGLGYFNGKIEDKAVDIHVLREALSSKHFKNSKNLFKYFKSGYKKIDSSQAKKVFERLTIIEKRGRYKK